MALNYSRHALPPSHYGSALQLFTLPALPGGQRLALDTNSNAIPGPCVVRVLADEAVWLDAERQATDLDTATTTIKLAAGVDHAFIVGQRETLYLRAAAA